MARHRGKTTPKECPVCQGLFAARRAQIYCGASCSGEGRRRRFRDKKAGTPLRLQRLDRPLLALKPLRSGSFFGGRDGGKLYVRSSSGGAL